MEQEVYDWSQQMTQLCCKRLRIAQYGFFIAQKARAHFWPTFFIWQNPTDYSVLFDAKRRRSWLSAKKRVAFEFRQRDRSAALNTWRWLSPVYVRDWSSRVRPVSFLLGSWLAGRTSRVVSLVPQQLADRWQSATAGVASVKQFSTAMTVGLSRNRLITWLPLPADINVALTGKRLPSGEGYWQSLETCRFSISLKIFGNHIIQGFSRDRVMRRLM